MTVQFSPPAEQLYTGYPYQLVTSSNLGMRSVELEGAGIMLVKVTGLAYGGVAGTGQARLPVQGGLVTVTGAGFDTTSTVSLNGGPAITPSAVSDTSLSFQAPAGTAGSQVAVAVRTGVQRVEVSQGLAYVVPALEAVSPSVGDINGNLDVSLSGTGFLPGASVKFGATSATNVVVAADGTSLTARTPPAAAGAVSVTVTNPGGSVSTQANGFTYVLPTQSIGISANAVNYNLATALGNPTQPKNFVVTVNAGIVLTASVSTTAAFDTGALPAGSTVTLVNRGYILGKGGAGAVSSSYGASSGSAGGNAVALRIATTIDNSNGYIWGGGGGGGAGASMGNNGSGGSGGGGAGGGAAATGCAANHCVDGFAGTSGPTGVGGTGGYNKYNAAKAGAGGAYGQAGAAGPAFGGYAGGGGGAAGSAVRRNGYAVTFISGSAAPQVKGLVN